MNNNETIKSLIARIEVLEEEVKKLKGKKKRDKTPGSKIWDAYASLYEHKYQVPPIRNAKTNKHCKDLFERLGEENAIDTVVYYMSLKEAWLMRNFHPLSALVSHCETIWAQMKSGKRLTSAEAKREEKVNNNVNASKEYLEKKHGNKSGRN